VRDYQACVKEKGIRHN